MDSREINGSLQPDIAPFVGRTDLLTTTTRLLRHARLVTLTGPAGVGKTRLAMRIARQTGADSVWAVDISAIAGQASRSPGSLYAHLALELNIRHNGSAGLDTVLDHLRGRSVLLLLDNCEHLVGPTREFLRRLLVAAPQVRILATSRQPLGVEGERRIVVPPLKPNDAIALFVDHAAAAGSDRAAVAADPDLSRLCERLDGLPLAITLAAARIPALSVRDLLALLNDRFALLRDVEVAVALSYDLCTEDERALWRCACVFADEFDLQAITALAGRAGLDTTLVLDTVTALVQKSILTADSASGRTRYGLLDTLRDYGLRALDQIGDGARLRQLHRDHARETAHRAATTWLGPDELDVMATVHQQLPDFLAAVDYSVARGELAIAREILRNVVRSRAPFFWGVLGLIAQHLDLVISTSIRSLAAAPGDADAAASAADVAATAAMAGWIAVTVGRRDDAERLITLAEELLDARGLGTIAPLLFAQGGHRGLVAGDSEGIGLLTAARALTPGPDLAGDRQMATMVRVMTICFTGDSTAAVVASEQYLRDAEQTGAPWDISWALWCRSLAALHDDDYEGAATHLDSCLRAQRTMDDRWGQTWSLELCGAIIAARLQDADNPAAEARRSQWLLGATQARQDQLGVSLHGLRPFAALRATAEQANSRYLNTIAMAAAFDNGTKAHQDALGVALGESPPRSRRGGSHPGGLTDRERQVVELVAAGLKSADIGLHLHLSTATVDTHVRRILSKLDLHNRAALATWAAENAISS